MNKARKLFLDKRKTFIEKNFLILSSGQEAMDFLIHHCLMLQEECHVVSSEEEYLRTILKKYKKITSMDLSLPDSEIFYFTIKGNSVWKK